MNGARRLGRIEVRADDPSLTGHGGLVVIGDLADRLGLLELIDGEIARERRARPVKTRRRVSRRVALWSAWRSASSLVARSSIT